MPSIERWRQVWKRFGVSAPNEIFQDLIARYSEPHRKYHTMQHLDECFDKLQEIRAAAVHPNEIELALWFHDAIYDVKRQDNEERSADWARSTALATGLSISIAERVRALVMATRHDAMPNHVDEQILVDVDLSILGAKPDRFDEYERQVREEYHWIPDLLFEAKRRRVLTQFLERSKIFSTEQFLISYEAQARTNLQRSIKKLMAKQALRANSHKRA
jgi:predicted metal-dependent HD superfamily phosphohydrolase